MTGGGLLTGKVAIVTGAATGLGRATVERFVNDDARVVIADIDEERGSALAADLGTAAAFRRTDVSDADSVQGAVDFAVEHFGGLDVMVNNAGISEPIGRFLDTELDDFPRMMSVNLLGVMLGAQRAARYMRDHGGGSIVNNSSIGGISPGGGVMTYRAAKAAVNHVSRCLAVELAPYGIRVNCVAPGHIATEMTAYDMEAVVRMTQPLQRLGTPDDFASAVAFLASDQSAQITGVVLPIDGGTTAGPPPPRLKEIMPDER
jgi:NAD(P)-dependent dehydrogenase (short-subunit alcohol dehydrogenase family)